MKVLLVEDSHVLQRSLSTGLRNSGYTVDQAFDGEEAIGFISTETYDVIVLDLMLPKISGTEILQRLRLNKNKTGVLILSAKDQLEDRIVGLDSGADDYLVKPFSFEELLSRLRALYRRLSDNSEIVDPTIRIGELAIDTNNRTVSISGSTIILTPSEYSIIELLGTRRTQTFSHDRMIDKLYSSDQLVTRNAIEAHISSLRKKLKESGIVDLIKTRRGFGYYIA